MSFDDKRYESAYNFANNVMKLTIERVKAFADKMEATPEADLEIFAQAWHLAYDKLNMPSYKADRFAWEKALPPKPKPKKKSTPFIKFS